MVAVADKPTLLLVSYYDLGTGFFCVIKNLTEQLHPFFNIHYVGIGYHGQPVRMPHWTLYPGIFQKNDYCAEQCRVLADQLPVGTLLIVNDLWVVGLYRNAVSRLKDKWKIMAYTPIDGTIPRNDVVMRSAFVDHLIVYTEFAKQEIERVIELVTEKDGKFRFPPISIVQHGLDSAFHRMDED